MKNNKFLIALALCLGLSPMMSCAQQYYTNSPQQTPSLIYPTSYASQSQYTNSPTATNYPLQSTPSTPRASNTTASSSWTPKFVSDFWTGAKEATQSVASYIPGHKKIGLGNIKQWSSTRLLASLSAAMYGLVKLGYNYDVILETFVNLATKIWDKTTVANALIAAATVLSASAVATDVTGK